MFYNVLGVGAYSEEGAFLSVGAYLEICIIISLLFIT